MSGVDGGGVVTKVTTDPSPQYDYQIVELELPSTLQVLLTSYPRTSEEPYRAELGREVRFRGKYYYDSVGGRIDRTYRLSGDCKDMSGWVEYEGKRYD